MPPLWSRYATLGLQLDMVYGCFYKSGSLYVGDPLRRALLLGVYARAPVGSFPYPEAPNSPKVGPIYVL